MKQRAAAFRRERDSARRVTWAIASVYGGVLVGIAILWRLVAADEELQSVVTWAFLGIELTVGLIAIALLGAGALRRSLAGPMAARVSWWGPVVGLATFALSWSYVWVLLAIVGESPDREPVTIMLFVEAVVLAPLAEEWLCRGVVWDSLRRVSSARTTLILSSVLFGLLHCIGGLLGFPHRFVGGLALGWLRERTGSLLPGILAHAVHNALAVFW